MSSGIEPDFQEEVSVSGLDEFVVQFGELCFLVVAFVVPAYEALVDFLVPAHPVFQVGFFRFRLCAYQCPVCLVDISGAEH